MIIKVLAFGVAKEIFGAPSIDVSFGKDVITVDALKGMLQQTYPRLQQLSSYMIAVNNDYAKGAEVIGARDEVAVIPPVSGG